MLKMMIQGVVLVWVNSARATPTPTELPAWKEVQTRKTPIPITIPAPFPQRAFIELSKDCCVAYPILADMLVNITMKNMATAMIHNRENPKLAPSLEVMVILLGPKTSAAIINPGPRPFSQEMNFDCF